MVILNALASGGLLTVLLGIGLGLGFVWALDFPKRIRIWVVLLGVSLVPISQFLPEDSVFRQQIAQSLGAIGFLVMLAVPFLGYAILIRALRKRAGQNTTAPSQTKRYGLGLIEDDAALYAENLEKLNALTRAALGRERETFSIVYRDDSGEIAASTRVSLLAGQAELRVLWVTEAMRRKGIGTIIVSAAEDEARRRGASLMVLYTFSWQSPAFYTALNYDLKYTRPVPGAGEEHFYEKAL